MDQVQDKEGHQEGLYPLAQQDDQGPVALPLVKGGDGAFDGQGADGAQAAVVIEMEGHFPDQGGLRAGLAEGDFQRVGVLEVGLVYRDGLDIRQAHDAFHLHAQLRLVQAPQAAGQGVVVAAADLFDAGVQGLQVAAIFQVKLEGAQDQGEQGAEEQNPDEQTAADAPQQGRARTPPGRAGGRGDGVAGRRAGQGLGHGRRLTMKGGHNRGPHPTGSGRAGG